MKVRVIRREDGSRDIMVTPPQTSGLPKVMVQKVTKDKVGDTVQVLLDEISAKVPKRPSGVSLEVF